MVNKRHEKILEIIQEEPIETQEVLQKRLSEEGFKVTQATVSRDIRQLGLVKVLTQKGLYCYANPPVTDKEENEIKNDEDIHLNQFMKTTISAVDYARNTVVLKCKSGTAQAVCAMLDDSKNNKVVGTIAGDDTIFILMRTEKDAKKFSQVLEAFFING